MITKIILIAVVVLIIFSVITCFAIVMATTSYDRMVDDCEQAKAMREDTDGEPYWQDDIYTKMAAAISNRKVVYGNAKERIF